jgi:hypothetical protein
MMLGNANGTKSNSFTGVIESGELKRGSGSNSPIACAISNARAAAMGPRSNSFTKFIASSLNGSSDKSKTDDDKPRKNSFIAAVSASLNASSDRDDKGDLDKDKKDKDKDKE